MALLKNQLKEFEKNWDKHVEKRGDSPFCCDFQTTSIKKGAWESPPDTQNQLTTQDQQKWPALSVFDMQPALSNKEAVSPP